MSGHEDPQADPRDLRSGVYEGDRFHSAMLPSWDHECCRMKIIRRLSRRFSGWKDDEAFAPSLLWFELRNLLLANERRQRITPAQTAAALTSFKESPLRLDGQADSDTTLRDGFLEVNNSNKGTKSDMRVYLTDSAQID